MEGAFREMKKSWLSPERIVFVMCIVLVILLYPMMYIGSEDTVTFTLKMKDREVKGRGESTGKYILYSEEGEVFECTDSWLFLRFNSSDVYGRFDVGERYRVRVAGWRVPFLSWYRNVIEIERVTTPDAPGLVDEIEGRYHTIRDVQTASPKQLHRDIHLLIRKVRDGSAK